MSKTLKIDYLLLFSTLCLSAIGLVMVFSASPTMALKLGDTYYFIKRHILYLLLGFSALYFGLRIDLKSLKRWSNLIFLVSLVLLLLIYLPGLGKKISGASRWIDLMLFTFQPSELIKFTMILFLANLLSSWKERIKNFGQGLVPILIVMALVCGLIVAQPDLGTAVMICVTSFIMLFAAGAELIHLAALFGIGVLGVLILALSSPYRMRRIIAYLDPWQDPQGIGFHIIQSLYAIGSGGLFGLGLGASRQKFFYLPQQFTDFIFAILCEEMGFMGGAFVVILFIIFAARGFRIAFLSKDNFNYLLATGLVSWISLQAIINLMVVVGLIPTTGIPLPFISYGGTATVVGLFSVGILLNISMETKQ